MTLGQVIEGRYRIGDKVGVGGMSTVYMGRDMQTGQAVAIKLMDEKLTDDPDYRARFEREAQVGVSLNHPGIAKVLAYGKEDDRHYLVMEYVQGITLTEYLRKKGPLPIEEAVAIASSVLTILSYAYSKGIQAHRDIKPGNIMIDLRTHAVTVMDFGIAKTVGSSLTHSTVLYTPRYAAPEQLLPSKFGGVVDKRADLYALGVVLYEMLTGRVPFAGETPAEISGEQITSPPPSPSSIRRDIPAPLSQVLLTCLQANPSHRYQTPEDLLQDLREGRPSSTRETTETVIRKEPAVPLTPEPPPPRRRSRVLVPLLALVLVILIPLTIMLVRGAKSEPPVAVTATLTITSTPPGAQVSLDGTSSGTTPLTKTVPPGTYIVLLTLSGYEDYRETITLSAGGTRQVNAPLTKKVGMMRKAVAIAAGGLHSLALAMDGSLWAWGSNDQCELGDGTKLNRSDPVRVGNRADWLRVAAGRRYSLALTSNGALWGWGSDMYNQLGDWGGTATNPPTPVRIGTRNDWIDVAAGEGHSLALASDGSIWAWGSNSIGQLGDGTTTDRSAPVSIGTRTDWTALATNGNNSLALASDGTLWAWGNIDNMGMSSLTPIRIGTRTNWIAISAGYGFSLALASDDSLWAWGWNGQGQLGDGTAISRSVPVRVGPSAYWAAISAGINHSLALASDGSLWAWGSNDTGQLGDGTTTSRSTPVRVGIRTDWVAIAAGAGHSLALASDGSLWAWGYNAAGQLGDGTTTDRWTPTSVNLGR